MDHATSQLTRFFRNSDQLKALEYLILPDLIARKRESGERNLSVWSAGCSTGEEAYSLAMLIRELLPAGFAVSIIATDRSSEALAVAKRGVYPEGGVSGVPPRLLRRCLSPVADGYAVVPPIRDLVRFELGEIGFAGEGGDYDLVVCRNVLTYVPEDERAAFAASLWRAMAAYSYLLLGGSESLLGVESRFEYLSNEWCSVYRKR